jgi:hypothetical protein
MKNLIIQSTGAENEAEKVGTLHRFCVQSQTLNYNVMAILRACVESFPETLKLKLLTCSLCVL